MLMPPNCVIPGVAFWLSVHKGYNNEGIPILDILFLPVIATNEATEVSANEVITTIYLIIN